MPLRNIPTPARIDYGAERTFVGAVWLSLSIALFAYAYRFGRNVPYWDDWEHIPVLTGARAFDLSWLVDQTLEHRYVLAKALLYGIWIASGSDFRAPMWISAAILCGLAAACIHCMRVLRGRTLFVDAFFPLLLLNWGHHENQIFFVQLCFVLPVTLFLTLLFAIATDWWKSRWGLPTVALCIVLLPPNGAIGLLLTIPLLLWCLYVLWGREEIRSRWPLGAVAVAASLECLLYFRNFSSPQFPNVLPHSFSATVRGSLEVLSVAFGPEGEIFWPYLGVAVAVLGVGISAMLARSAFRNPAERDRAIGLLCGMAAIGLLTTGIGYGRSVLGVGTGFMSRYALLIAPALSCAFIAAELYGTTWLRRLIPMILFTSVCAMFVSNLRGGTAYARVRDAAADGLVADVAAGMPVHVIAQRHPQIYPVNDLMAERLTMMRAAGVGPYRDVPAHVTQEPICRATPVALRTLELHQVTANGDAFRGDGNDPFIVYALPQALRVCGVKIDYDIDGPRDTVPITQLFWKLAASGEEFDATVRNTTAASRNGIQSKTFWIYASIDHFRFDPDTRPITFRVRSITLLIEDLP